MGKPAPQALAGMEQRRIPMGQLPAQATTLLAMALAQQPLAAQVMAVR